MGQISQERYEDFQRAQERFYQEHGKSIIGGSKNNVCSCFLKYTHYGYKKKAVYARFILTATGIKFGTNLSPINPKDFLRAQTETNLYEAFVQAHNQLMARR